MRAIPAQELQTNLAAVRRLLVREKKKLAEERVWHAWTAAFWIHENICCTTLEIQMEEMKDELERLREAAKDGTLIQSFSEEPLPKILCLRGGMEDAAWDSWDAVASWRQDLAVHRSLIREGIDIDYSLARYWRLPRI